MTTESTTTDGNPIENGTTENDPTEYRVRLDRGACEGIFACLVRDHRFAEASDGLATIDGVSERETEYDELTATFADGRLDDARQAARACPVGAIDVTEVDDE